MALGLSPQALASRSARRPWVTVGLWLAAIVVAMALIVLLIGDALQTDVGPTNSPESERAEDLLDERFTITETTERTEVVLVRSTGLTVEDPAFQAFVEGVVTDFLGLGPELIPSAVTYYDTGDQSLVSLDRHTTGVVLTRLIKGDQQPYWDMYEERGEGQRVHRADPLVPDEAPGKFQVHSFRAGGNSDFIVIRSETLTVDQDEYRQFTEDLFFDLVAQGQNVVWGGATVYQSGDPSMVSADGHATIVPIGINGSDSVHVVLDVIKAARSDNFNVTITGRASLDADFNELSASDLEEGELKFGLPMAIIVLIFVFGALVTASIPLVLAIISIIIALGLSMLFAQFMNISVFLVNMVFMMGLAVEIDYSLFIVARFREERAAGKDKHEAIRIAGATASQAVLFSGITVLLALTGLLLIRQDIFVSLGLGAILVVFVAIIASLTLLPAVLSLLGDRTDAVKLPFIYRWQAGSGDPNATGMWGTISHTVMKAPVLSVVLSGGLLIAALSPVFFMNIGAAGVSSLPESFESKAGYEALERDFAAGLTSPVVIAIDGQADAPAVLDAIDALRQSLDADEVFGEVEELVNPAGDTVRLVSPIGGGDGASPVALDAVERLRNDYVPAAFDGVPSEVFVGGETAEAVDYITESTRGLFIVIPFILVLSFVLLTVVFRSLVVPIKAIIMNLLSVGAAYGLLVLVFQEGWANSFFGFHKVDAIEAWVPVFLFAVLFGLSMDYHVFLLSRIREKFMETGDNTAAVVHGVKSTGRLITGAALIMVAVFVGFASGDLVMFEQMGFGLAVAVILDATIVRSVLVPASMRLLGGANWYLPSWLQWLPEFKTE
jgi:putative drug exporter of the RND superfamily